MARRNLAVVSSLSLLTSACPLDRTHPFIPAPQSSPAPQTCLHSDLPLSQPRPGYTPWTHPPTCTTINPKGDKLCVFTDATYHSGRGLSIVARPQVVGKLLDDGVFPGRKDIPDVSQEAKYEARIQPGMGTGLFVKDGHSFEAGEVILTDYPTLILPAEGFEGADADVLQSLAWKGLLQLPKEGRDVTRGLARSKAELGVDEIVDLVDTNAFTHEDGGGVHNVLFPLASRMNHACVPNAITRTNETTLSLEVIALKTIPSGAQIFNSYLDPSQLSSSAERAHSLQSMWSFPCRCDICAGAGVSRSDARRRELAQARAQLENSKGNAVELLKGAETILKLMAEEGMVIPRGQYLELAAMATKYLGKIGEAREWARKAKKHWDIILGEHSEESKEMVEFEKELGGQ
ncbi:hypothetical protein QBC34DRAFT_310134 [Podospora aff. communis PSN243]|uniref:SET domain-containing protein n=1 Tax=Podospora aff. communis PSN243 TaxID=3040156 RepID=A0AAV9G6W8_9PEZI|nr:hypothetical protein QBC34DRAFT_310134 [Podospora aff. communis PSN243]